MSGQCILPPATGLEGTSGSFLNLGSDAAGAPWVPVCNTSADCAGLPTTVCEEVGVCPLQLTLCTPSIACPSGAGLCGPYPNTCIHQTRCDAADYTSPAVPISNAATRSAQIVDSLTKQVPNGLTPTGPALQGALAHARLWAEQHPERQVATVLATDGLPTECTPLQIPEIGDFARAAAGDPRPVRTFVLGVFSSADLGADGQGRLDALASAGGTERAFIADTAGNVSESYSSALQTIQARAAACGFVLEGAAALAPELVNVELEDAVGGVRALLQVGAASDCANTSSGWYYVRDGVGSPVRIQLCPSACPALGGSDRVQLELGCATLTL
jgi:hypothetical protein